MRQIDTYRELKAQYGTVLVPLEEVCELYFGLSYRAARQRRASLPIKVIKMGTSQKAPLFVHLQDLARFVDHQRLIRV